MTLISANGGVGPRWRRDGKELFYIEGDWVIAVDIRTSPTISVDSASRLFEDKNRFGSRSLRYDVTPDGQRFVFPETLEKRTQSTVALFLPCACYKLQQEAAKARTDESQIAPHCADQNEQFGKAKQVLAKRG